MAYIKAGQYPITDGMIRQNHPNTSFPIQMQPLHVEAFGYSMVHPVPTPDYDGSTQEATEAAPVFTGGIWVQQWNIVPLPPKTDEELDAETLAKLRESDIASIGSMREYLASLPMSPQLLKDQEAEVVAVRSTLKLSASLDSISVVATTKEAPIKTRG